MAPARPALLESETLAGVWLEIRALADALGVPERGVQLVTRLRARMDAVAARAAGQADRPRVAFLDGIEPLTAAGRWTPELVAMAGGVDLLGIRGGPARSVAWDELLAADPDVIVVAPRGLGLARAREEAPALSARAGWSDMRAVRANRVYLGDGAARFDRPGSQVAEALEILAEVLHPGAFRFGHGGRGWERWPLPAPDVVARPRTP